jgi:hypothetical protein
LVGYCQSRRGPNASVNGSAPYGVLDLTSEAYSAYNKRHNEVENDSMGFDMFIAL